MTNNKKHFGIVYTPTLIVDQMLDKIPSLKDVSICDPSCGDGQFLVAVVERICKKIKYCRNENERKAYFSTLRKLTGFDIDDGALKQCRKRLNKVLKDKDFEYKSVKWNLRKIDAIDKDAWIDFTGFDYVIGNPPYVRIQHLEDSRRMRINKGDWRCMNGCADLFILFFEMGLELLKKGGKLIYITPSSWMKSNSGRALREIIQTEHTICSITDFGDHQVFDDVTTYTAITEIQSYSKKKKISHGYKCSGSENGIPKFIKGKIFFGKTGWQVLSKPDVVFMESLSSSELKLGDVADIQVGIQTLADDVFIFPKNSSLGMELEKEKGIIKRVLKASVMNNGEDKIDRIVIYPYNEKGKLIPEETLYEKFPVVYSYLLENKHRLLSRDKGKINPIKWYGYGREVSISSSFGDKLLTSGMNLKPKFQKCPDPNALFYSGYCVKPKPQFKISFPILLEELNSYNMENYIKIVSRPFRNGWFSYAKSFIQHFPVSEKAYDKIIGN